MANTVNCATMTLLPNARGGGDKQTNRQKVVQQHRRKSLAFCREFFWGTRAERWRARDKRGTEKGTLIVSEASMLLAVQRRSWLFATSEILAAPGSVKMTARKEIPKERITAIYGTESENGNERARTRSCKSSSHCCRLGTTVSVTVSCELVLHQKAFAFACEMETKEVVVLYCLLYEIYS